jgi:hypothetical protein
MKRAHDEAPSMTLVHHRRRRVAPPQAPLEAPLAVQDECRVPLDMLVAEVVPHLAPALADLAALGRTCRLLLAQWRGWVRRLGDGAEAPRLTHRRLIQFPNLETLVLTTKTPCDARTNMGSKRGLASLTRLETLEVRTLCSGSLDRLPASLRVIDLRGSTLWHGSATHLTRLEELHLVLLSPTQRLPARVPRLHVHVVWRYDCDPGSGPITDHVDCLRIDNIRGVYQLDDLVQLVGRFTRGRLPRLELNGRHLYASRAEIGACLASCVDEVVFVEDAGT